MQTNQQRRDSDRYPSEPRATYATCTVRGNCQLVRVGSLAHAYMKGMNFDEIDREGDCALMRCPPNWAEGSLS